MSERSSELGARLVAIARRALQEAVGGPAVEAGPARPDLDDPGASFVTLTVDGELRGCIGALRALRPLAEDVARNARAAALEDGRFPPVERHELDRISIEVSVLTPLEEIEHQSEEHLLAQLRPGTDGLVIEQGGLRATFLPQVWKSLREPERFLSELKDKAGLPPDLPAERLRAWRFTVESFEE